MAHPLRFEDLPEILTPQLIMEYLQYDSLHSVYKLLRDGRIRVIGGKYDRTGRLIGRDNRKWRIAKRNLKAYIGEEGA